MSTRAGTDKLQQLKARHEPEGLDEVSPAQDEERPETHILVEASCLGTRKRTEDPVVLQTEI